ncbi:hypothetical protein BDV09DRAFT_147413 [Aspergillus tetrazonus]
MSVIMGSILVSSGTYYHCLANPVRRPAPLVSFSFFCDSFFAFSSFSPIAHFALPVSRFSFSIFHPRAGQTQTAPDSILRLRRRSPLVSDRSLVCCFCLSPSAFCFLLIFLLCSLCSLLLLVPCSCLLVLCSCSALACCCVLPCSAPLLCSPAPLLRCSVSLLCSLVLLFGLLSALSALSAVVHGRSDSLTDRSRHAFVLIALLSSLGMLCVC